MLVKTATWLFLRYTILHLVQFNNRLCYNFLYTSYIRTVSWTCCYQLLLFTENPTPLLKILGERYASRASLNTSKVVEELMLQVEFHKSCCMFCTVFRPIFSVISCYVYDAEIFLYYSACKF